MATLPTPQGGNGGSGRGGNSIAAIVRAALNSLATVLTAWGRMPAVKTRLDYLGRRLPLWGILCVGGLLVGGEQGTIVVVGSMVGLLLDTAFSIWPR
jgi:hypothetical protein